MISRIHIDWYKYITLVAKGSNASTWCYRNNCRPICIYRGYQTVKLQQSTQIWGWCGPGCSLFVMGIANSEPNNGDTQRADLTTNNHDHRTGGFGCWWVCQRTIEYFPEVSPWMNLWCAPAHPEWEPYSRVLLDNSERLLLVISCNAMEKVMLNHQHWGYPIFKQTQVPEHDEGVWKAPKVAWWQMAPQNDLSDTAHR